MNAHANQVVDPIDYRCESVAGKGDAVASPSMFPFEVFRSEAAIIGDDQPPLTEYLAISARGICGVASGGGLSRNPYV